MQDYEIIQKGQQGGMGKTVWLLQHKPTDTYTVVHHDQNNAQVSDAMKEDAPEGGGSWVSGVSDAGIDYVSNRYNYGKALSRFEKLTKEL